MNASDIVLLALLGIGVYTDLKYRIIPDTVPFGFVCYFLFSKAVGFVFIPTEEAIYGLLLGWGLTFAFSLLNMMGYGDVKLLSALGTWFGLRVFDVFMLSFVIGLFFATFYYFKYKDRKAQIPFGPSIAIATLLEG